jgi:hypothetical protein
VVNNIALQVICSTLRKQCHNIIVKPCNCAVSMLNSEHLVSFSVSIEGEDFGNTVENIHQYQRKEL